MRLETYLQREQMSVAVFARAMARYLGEAGAKQDAAITSETVRRYTLDPNDENHRRPRQAQMRAIYVLTGGAVQPNDLHDLPELTDATKRRAAQLIDEAKRSAAQAAYAGRVKGARGAARARAFRAHVKRGAR